MTNEQSGGIDCHVHVIDPARFPPPGGRGFQPTADDAGPLRALMQLLDANGLAGALVVQLSGYGSDNATVVDALQTHPSRLRGIAVVDDDISDAALDALSARGVVGARFNLPSYDPQALSRPGTARLLARLAERQWVAQVYAQDAQWVNIAPLLTLSGVRVIVDHLGLERPSPDLPGFSEVLELGRSGRAVVKLSSMFRISQQATEHWDLDPFAEALIEAFGLDNCVWGSDWPFPAVARRPQYGDMLAILQRWIPDTAERRRVLVDNPRRIFGFNQC